MSAILKRPMCRFEAEESSLVIFVGFVPVVIDVFFKYWIFIGLNRISPGAVITLKQVRIDTFLLKDLDLGVRMGAGKDR